MNALTMLKTDHQTVETLFKKFEGLSDRAKTGRMKIVQQIIKELSIHAVIEEQVLYPAARDVLKQDGDMVLEALEEHHVVKWLLSELDGMSPEAERYNAKVTVLIENVRHHVKEEETELFPRLRRLMDRRTLDDLGESLARAKRMAPTRPHPRAPDAPPGNLMAGVGAAVVDRVRDAGRAVMEKATSSRGRNTSTHANGIAPR